jgi:hypothetical protein
MAMAIIRTRPQRELRYGECETVGFSVVIGRVFPLALRQKKIILPRELEESE